MSSDLDGIYRPPDSHLGTQPSPIGDFGSVERALQGDYQLRFDKILSEAWSLLKGSKRIILMGILVQMVFTWTFQGILAVFGGDPTEFGDIMGQSALGMLPNLIAAPIGAGMMIFAIKRAGGAPHAGFDELVANYDRFVPIAGLLIVKYLLIIFGFALLILPGIYLSVAYAMALPLLVEKNMGIWEALETSRKAINFSWFTLFGYYLAVGLICLFGILVTLLIGILWAMPFSYLCYGIIYRNIFGLEPETLHGGA